MATVEKKQITSIGRAMRALRLQRHLNAMQHAERLNISPSTLSGLERRDNPGLDSLQRIAASFGMTLWQFIQYWEQHHKDERMNNNDCA